MFEFKLESVGLSVEQHDREQDLHDSPQEEQGIDRAHGFFGKVKVTS